MSAAEEADLPQDEEVCGETFDHDTEITGTDEDGTIYWRCRRCDAEGWEAAEA